MIVIILLVALMAIVTIRECVKIYKIKDNASDSHIHGKKDTPGS